MVTIAAIVAGSRIDSVGGAAASRPASNPATGPTASPAGRPGPTEADLRRAVRQLNHPTPEKRRAAIRQLAEWGPLAFEELRRAAAGRDLEAAILARDLLAELEAAILIGARVRIDLDRTRIAWDDSVTLIVHAHNPTAGAIRVPWPRPKNGSATQPARDDAGQVAAMLDAADFLVVTGPDAAQLDLRIEPIDRDPAVYRAVDVRARSTPPSHVIEPGESATLQVPLFNRGWARYPMLSAGTYTIAFAYQPQWQDESWTKEGFGLVRAGPITVEVLRSAPESIRRSTRPLALRLSRDADVLIARLESTWDFPQWINLNLGSELAVHGRLEWRLLPAGRDDAEPVVLDPPATPPVLVPDRIRQIAPGETLTIARMPVAQLGERLRAAGHEPTGKFELSVRYLHVATREQLREELPPGDRHAELPVHIFSGSVRSESVRIDFGGGNGR